jgi:hypothetical protein
MTFWKEHSGLIGFLSAQCIALVAAGATMLAYFTKLETRVSIMETRGAEYTVARMEEMKLRISKIEQATDTNADSIKRIIDVMTRELGKPVK